MNQLISNVMQMLNCNPNQLIQQNPQAQILFNQMRQSGMSMRDFTIQYARQNNIDLQPVLNALMQKGIRF